MKSLISVVSLMAVSAAAVAHPGHDHTAVVAGLSHVVFYGGLALSVVVAGAVLFKKVSKKQDNK